MSLLTVALGVLLVVMLLYLLNAYIPEGPKARQRGSEVVAILTIVAVLIWLLRVIGIAGR